jgi:hypothetical protein
MSTPEPAGPDRGQDDPVRAVVRLFLGQLLAVVAIAAAITVVVTLVAPDDSTLRTSAPATSPDGPVGADSPSDAATTGTPGPTPSTPATTAPAPTTPTTTAPTRDRRQQRPRVDVLNQSAGNGAATTVAARLRRADWRIGRVEDFSGNVSTTTVYWLDRGDRRAARRLAEDLGGVRVQQGFSTLVDGRLSVVLVERP